MVIETLTLLINFQGHSYYIAGCRDNLVASRSELYDLLVNLPAREITVAPHAKGIASSSYQITEKHCLNIGFFFCRKSNDD